ncbi:hypothetical protein D3Y57_09885 [Sphingomonas paeninsulae]|uniref:Restriction alleviation protein Lar n=1 Tax=Sphingomonas paeninsulae TaxID=2319844 RepID=A0A494TAY1_SPHPE|nr:hypothetical protein D3Y57_09885 [Sphingomonas paeninsulae]
MSRDLKTCPFCAGDVAIVGYSDLHWGKCTKCGTHGPGKWSSKNDAATAWNTRAALSGASEVVESQKEDVRSIPNQICSHDWQESVSSQFSNEYRVEVYCPKCCTYGEKEYETGEITWPCT